MPVYVIQAGDGPCKIGTAKDVKARLASLQIGAHEPLRLIAVYVGSFPHERLLHQHFKAFRLDGEWFNLRLPDALSEIELEPLDVPGLVPVFRPPLVPTYRPPPKPEPQPALRLPAAPPGPPARPPRPYMGTAEEAFPAIGRFRMLCAVLRARGVDQAGLDTLCASGMGKAWEWKERGMRSWHVNAFARKHKLTEAERRLVMYGRNFVQTWMMSRSRPA